MMVQVQFLPEDIWVTAEPGESLLEVADRAGVTIPTGCLMGSCCACEVELGDLGEARACITAIPGGRSQLTVNLFSDPTW